MRRHRQYDHINASDRFLKRMSSGETRRQRDSGQKHGIFPAAIDVVNDVLLVRPKRNRQPLIHQVPSQRRAPGPGPDNRRGMNGRVSSRHHVRKNSQKTGAGL